MENTDTVKILIYDNGRNPIHKEKYELLASQSNEIKELILKSLNRLGKGGHALIKYRNDYFVADHTAQGKLESESYYRTKVKYHPFMSELL